MDGNQTTSFAYSPNDFLAHESGEDAGVDNNHSGNDEFLGLIRRWLEAPEPPIPDLPAFDPITEPWASPDAPHVAHMRTVFESNYPEDCERRYRSWYSKWFALERARYAEESAKERLAAYRAIPRFGDVALDLAARGWTAMPQQADSDRKPGWVAQRGSAMLQWAELSVVGWRPKELATLLRIAPRNKALNAAILLGSASGNTFAFDVDINDPEKAAVARSVIEAVCGPTPFVRSRAGTSKIALVYSYDFDDVIRKSKVATPFGEVEILGPGANGTGAPLTSHGPHWRDDRPFEWSTNPTTTGPQAAPLVARTQVAEVARRLGLELGVVKTLRPVYEGTPDAPYIEGSMRIPGGGLSVQGATYSAAGKVIDGRETFVRDRSYAIWNANGGAPDDVLRGAILSDVLKHIELSGRWTRQFLEDQVRTKVLALRSRVRNGRDTRRVTASGEQGRSYAPRNVVEVPHHAEIEAIVGPNRKALTNVRLTAPDPRLAAIRALPTGAARAEATDRVQRDVERVVQDFLDALWDVERAVDDEAKDEARARLDEIVLLIAPTGAGKTTTLLRLLPEQILRRGPLGKSIALMMPGYDNIGEALGKAKGFATSSKAVMKVTVYEGKGRNCLEKETHDALAEAGIGTSQMCEADVVTKRGDETETVHHVCDHAARDVCPVIHNRREALTADLLLLPTKFLGLPMPKAVKNSIAGVVVDERCWGEFLGYTEVPTAVFDLPRGGFAPTKAERLATGVSDQRVAWDEAVGVLTGDREEAAKVLKESIRAGRDPARDFLAYKRTYGKREVTGRTIAQAAKSVVGRSADRRKEYWPNMSKAAVAAVVNAPRGQWLWPERAVWSAILERMDAIEDGTATGTHDARLQLLDKGVPGQRNEKGDIVAGGESMRVSWRSKSPLEGHPTLLMDASASPEIVEKLWGGRSVKTVDIEAPLNQLVIWCPNSTYADVSYVPKSALSLGTDAVLNACVTQDKVRLAANSLAHIYGNGRVLLGATKKGRISLLDGWREPENLDTGHYNAMVGLDFAKDHSALMVVGRQEMPPRVVDGLVAALTFDDPEPELPIDRFGNGLQGASADSKPMKPNVVERVQPVRDGSNVIIEVPEHAGAWAKLIQRQGREEQQRQLIGRLRPVYRREAAMVVVMSSVIPEGMIVDAVVHGEDLLHDSTVWEAMRRTGVLDKDACVGNMGGRGGYDVQRLLDETANGLHTRRTRGLAKAKVTYKKAFDAAPQERTVVVSQADGIDRVERCISSVCYLGETLSIEIVERGAPPIATEPRPADPKIDDIVGDRHDRTQNEYQNRSQTILAIHEAMGIPPRWDSIRMLGRKVSIEIAIAYRVATGGIERILERGG